MSIADSDRPIRRRTAKTRAGETPAPIAADRVKKPAAVKAAPKPAPAPAKTARSRAGSGQADAPPKLQSAPKVKARTAGSRKVQSAAAARKAPASPPVEPAAAIAGGRPGTPEETLKEAPAGPGPADGAAPPPLPDFDALAQNLGKFVEEAGKAVAAFVRPRETGEVKSEFSEEVADAARSIGKVAEFWLSDPQRALQAQTGIATRFLDLWGMTLKRLSGEEAAPVVTPPRGDKRFSAPEWQSHPLFDFLHQAYMLTTAWADDLAERADSVDPHVQAKARFYIRQLTSALSPSNFVPTNPELIAETLKENGENLVRGMRMMAQDIAAGHGNLKIRQSDSSKFELGVNLAATPGKVIYRNDLIELLQYAPMTEQVYKRPLLIVPPWINKFYILDLNPEKSFIRWAVSQGFTVFTISWVNPDERHAAKDFESYMREGIFAALEAIEKATGERKVSAIGYCVGGTLLASTLAYMAATGDERIESTTFFTTQVDFTDPGELKVFVDEAQIQAVEAKMEERGYLEGSKMASAFNMLRPNDLIWSYYVNNYLRGKEPMPFDLLTWNSDSTRMPRANHSFYLRNCYLENNLSHGRMELGGVRLDLSKVTMPIYNLAAREDHIAPAKSVFVGSQFFGGPVRYVMAGSGHIAGVVNPPAKPKYQYWLGDAPRGDFEAWVASAREIPGSWWPDWSAWMQAQSPARVAAREPGAGALKPLGDAPGEYVKARV